jgi:anti-sigma factor RsiW
MDCNRAEALLNAYIDGELDLSSTLTLEAHLATCRSCREKHLRLSDLVADLQAGLERYPAPADLRERLTLTVRPSAATAVADLQRAGAVAIAEPAMVIFPPRSSDKASSSSEGGSRRDRPRFAANFGRRQLLALAASIAGVALVSGSATYWLTRPGGEGHELAEEVVASHIRSLMASHLVDIASADQHTVKPWFDGKVDVAPTVADYSAQGFSLMGGRLDYLERRPVAALVYRHRSHVINVFACPVMAGEEHETTPEAANIRGYNLLYWTAGDVTYWVVSDASRADLMTFRNLVQEASDARG